MKISFVDDEPDVYPLQYGGKARTIINLAKTMAGMADVEKVSILSSSIDDKRHEFTWEGVHFKKLNGYSTIPHIVREANTADVLSIHNCSIAFPRLRDAKAALIYQLHDVLLSNADRGSHLDKVLCGEWDAVIAPSDFAASVYSSFLPQGSRDAQLKIIPRPLDSNHFQPVNMSIARKKIGIGNEEFPVIFLPWRINAGKGEKFISFLTQILDEKYSKYLILTTFSNEGGLNHPHIKNVGWLPTESLPTYYSAADLVISFSMLPESFSQICIEALACGTPFLSFGYGNLKDLADKLPAAKVCPPTEEGIGQGLTEILDGVQDSDLETSQAIIDREFDHVLITQKYMDLFQKVIKAKQQKTSDVRASTVKRYLTSPLIVLYGDFAYLSSEEDIKPFSLSIPEKAILQTCRSPLEVEELYLTIGLEDVMIKPVLSSLVKRGMIIEL